MERKEEEQRVYIIDSNGTRLGYVLMGGKILYAMSGERVADVSEDMFIEELKRILLRRKTPYIV